jgi:hypothetical protein
MCYGAAQFDIEAKADFDANAWTQAHDRDFQLAT